MIEHNQRLAELRQQIYERLGAVETEVVSQVVPTVPWPDSALGCMRIVKRRASVLLITDGLSAFYNPALHTKLPPAPLDYELGIDVFNQDPRTATAEQFASSWYVDVLYSVADLFVAEWIDLRSALEKFGAITLTVSARSDDARKLANASGEVGLLIGQSLVSGGTTQHAYLNGYYSGTDPQLAEAALGLFPIKPLTPDELAWAVERGNDGPLLLAEKFDKRGDARLAWTGRQSVLQVPP